ncbi:glycosyltransferase [Lacisediminihabitans changchengi]|uniref:Glycosyltransferase family 4 protein n=1 Tax=Lacisediminihabitans changchengi TaxID=2787634 RepID=A0A934SLI5_9MICO|nr:glycosyltransferase [Lacisediminihabitans changchengi]MBK4346450.1 glycosyltransferase family 4 protein [Lacisediminihabitans changchengi]MBK4348922.1 glycosyltransferase family 4 protein [Lacisediminihabitans changchengi]
MFVGTNRKHKGVETLRGAVRQLQDFGVTLVVTDAPPADSEPWEDWVGNTTFEGGLELVRTGDIVVLPSIQTSMVTEAQLPAKLMDAMIAGRAIVVTNAEPLIWAVGEAALVVESDNISALADSLRKLSDPVVRRKFGDAIRERALSRFTVEAVLPDFRRACEDAIKGESGR